MMLRHQEGDRVFNVRAVAVVRSGARVLVQRSAGDAFLALPGGRVEWGETFAETVAREMPEELSEEVDVGPLLFVAENFFDLGGRRFHELDAYVETRLRDASPLLHGPGPFPSREAPGVTVEWVPLSELSRQDLPLKPDFLATALQAPSGGLRHVVQR